MSKGVGKMGSAMAIYSIQTSEFGSRRIGIVINDSSDIAGDLEEVKDYISTHFFYGTERDIADTYSRDSDFDAKAIQLKMIKSQLLN